MKKLEHKQGRREEEQMVTGGRDLRGGGLLHERQHD
jgi:hypothetical protein